MDHEYAGGRWHEEQLWKTHYNQRYFELLRTYHDVVAIEVAGHDHYGDLRYHSSNNLAGLDDISGSTIFMHNLLVTPGCTTYGKSNPGIAMFELNGDLVPHNLRFEFLDLDATFGKTSVPYSEAKFWSVDYAQQYGLQMLDGASVHNFYTTLKNQSEDDTLNYLIAKIGFDPADPTQRDQALAIYEGKDLVTSSKHHVGEYLCLMSHSSYSDEFADCCRSANSSKNFL